MPTPRRRLLGIVGPTASGKESLSLRIAQRLRAEILSLDSMKLYRGMDIGTSKASADDRERVRHHLVDRVEPHESFNVKRFVEEVDRLVPEIEARGHRPLLVGGTILYLKALLYGLSGPGTDLAIRSRLRRDSEQGGTAALHARLLEVDPDAGARIHRNDARRIVRALEVFEMTGRPISSFQVDFDREVTRYDARLVGIRRGREDLHRRIDARIQQMFEEGWIEEVRGILERGGFGREASQALGYREIVEHLGGKLTEAEAKERIAFATHRFARHQETWLRRFPQIHWIDADPEDDARSLEERALAWLDEPDTDREASPPAVGSGRGS